MLGCDQNQASRILPSPLRNPNPLVGQDQKAKSKLPDSFAIPWGKNGLCSGPPGF